MITEKKPLTIKGEVVRCKGCGKVLYERETHFEYPALFELGFPTGVQFTYCSRECALKNALIFCSGCGKIIKEGDRVLASVKLTMNEKDQVIRSYDFYCNECEET